MSVQPSYPPQCVSESGSVSLLIESRLRDLGGFSVRRVLPAAKRRMVGPFIFFDHMGPASFAPGQGMDVRPHPHIGLATVTYLFSGELIHRDSLGFVQPIRPGAVNLMTAGSGIVHSERSGEDRSAASELHGIQSWMALPAEHEETSPSFEHYAAETLPETQVGDARVRIIAGSAYGAASPVRTYSPLLYLDVRLPRGATFPLPTGCSERAVYVVAGAVELGGEACKEGDMAVAGHTGEIFLRSAGGAHVMIIGGEPVGERHIWWNFVARTEERIEQAKEDWAQDRFSKVPGDDEFIPLP
jgi:hypothetical protein